MPRSANDSVTAPEPEAAARRGRPRRFDEEEERSLLLDAAFEVIRTNGYAATTVADILGEAAMSTRSFYRHFASKEDLLHALFRRDAERFAGAVTARVRAAPNPRAALEVWVDEILGFAFDRPRAKRAAVLGSATAKGRLAPQELAHALHLLTVPLADTLASGSADGTFPLARPGDAALVSAATWDASTRMAEVVSKAARAELRDGLLSFVHRALGVDGH